MTRSTYEWPEFKIADPSISGPLAVFPIMDGEHNVDDYLLLSAALERGMASVREKSHGGSVPIILVDNKGKLPLLGIQGEEYVGSKQNRTFNLSFLVGPGKTEIPVTCVEQGRWGYQSPEFSPGHYEPMALRSMKASLLGRKVRSGSSDKFHADQGAVWDSVAGLNKAYSIESDTEAMADLYKNGKVSSSIDEILAGIELPENTRGVAVAVGGRVIGADIFETTPVFERMWPRLARSYALSAHRQKGTPPSLEAVETFLRAPIGSTWTATKSVALGEGVRWEGNTFVATALEWEGRMLHGSVFAN
jgi:hypothetical protein